MKLVQQYMEYDHKFATELLSSFILNLIEVRDSLTKSVAQKDVYIFLGAIGNAHTAIDILDNAELQTSINTMQQLLGNKGIAAVTSEIQNAFTHVCNKAISDLEKTMIKYKPAL